MPFELKQQLIVVPATIENKTGYFILDTGAPGLVLNAQYFEGATSAYQAAGLQEDILTQDYHVRSFNWACVKKQHFTALVIDLTHLEQIVEKQLFGLIGYDILKKWQVELNYNEQSISLYKGHKAKMQATTATQIPFRLKEHFVLIDMEIDKQVHRLILDSGSGVNYLHDVVNSPTMQATNRIMIIRSVDKIEKAYEQYIVYHSTIAETSFYNQLFTFVQTTEQHESDGLLGYPFLKNCTITIDYKRKRILLEKQVTNSVAIN